MNSEDLHEIEALISEGKGQESIFKPVKKDSFWTRIVGPLLCVNAASMLIVAAFLYYLILKTSTAKQARPSGCFDGMLSFASLLGCSLL
jgi:hypothetical protein